MTTLKKVLFISALAATQAYAYEIDTDACAGTEYIVDQYGKQVKYDPEVHTFVTETTPVTYKAWKQVPYLVMAPYNTSSVALENRSIHDVTFYFSPRYYLRSTGMPANISPETFEGIFSGSNNPISSVGANLKANTTGLIRFPQNSNVYTGSATMRWESQKCIEHAPVLATSHESWVGSNKGGFYRFPINNGNPW